MAIFHSYVCLPECTWPHWEGTIFSQPLLGTTEWQKVQPAALLSRPPPAAPDERYYEMLTRWFHWPEIRWFGDDFLYITVHPYTSLYLVWVSSCSEVPITYPDIPRCIRWCNNDVQWHASSSHLWISQYGIISWPSSLRSIRNYSYVLNVWLDTLGQSDMTMGNAL